MKQARGICIRCASYKDRALGSCPACGHRPEGEERVLAWLFSRNFLDEDELEEAAARLARRERPRPPARLQELARRALYPGQGGEAGARGIRPVGADAVPHDRGLSGEQQVLLGAASVLLTPLLGFVYWWSLRQRRPVSARQALWVTLPVALVMSVIWAWVMLVSGGLPLAAR
ncbi:MAG: hypothetical protein H6741_05330 [Alphaproteobacteria bacterium]|nr:hypothetical protein [Alphaproteobacteria bacterium]MCB9792128.1 hypothetical protein [Alphaproteobacteria bacterium]